MTRAHRLILAPLLLIALVTSGSSCGADPSPDTPQARDAPLPVRTVNDRPLSETKGAFRFVVSGHLYGAPGPGKPRPARNFRKWAQQVPVTRARFLLSLGDLFYSAEDPGEIETTLASLKEIPFPVVHVVGNHDLGSADPGWWTRRFGPTYFSFQQGPALFIALDTETTPWVIDDTQVQFLRRELHRAIEHAEIKTVFLLTHKLIWADTEELAAALVGSNEGEFFKTAAFAHRDHFPIGKAIRPTILEAAGKIPIHWLSGDAGAMDEGYALFFERETDTGITYAATGLGDRPRDGLLWVEVSDNGGVTYEFKRLDGRPTKPLADFGSERWTKKYFPDGIPAAYAPYLRGGLNRNR